MPVGIPRVMLSFAKDEGGEWFAELDCHHRRHIRHHPPLSSHPWILDAAGREGHVGQRIECERCGQRIWPDGVEATRATRVFDEHTVPAGLLADHRTHAGVWGRLEVIEGHARLRFAAPLGEVVELGPGEWAAIPPELAHALELGGPLRFRVVFYRRA